MLFLVFSKPIASPQLLNIVFCLHLLESKNHLWAHKDQFFFIVFAHLFTLVISHYLLDVLDAILDIGPLVNVFLGFKFMEGLGELLIKAMFPTKPPLETNCCALVFGSPTSAHVETFATTT